MAWKPIDLEPVRRKRPPSVGASRMARPLALLVAWVVRGSCHDMGFVFFSLRMRLVQEVT
jgi:hypothetical protein